MNILLRLTLTAVLLYFYLLTFVQDFSDRNYAIRNKIYLFLFVFITQFLIYFFTYIRSEKASINEVIEVSLNNALLAVVAFDIYQDMNATGYFLNSSPSQQLMILVILIIGFMTAIKILQLLISNQ